MLPIRRLLRAVVGASPASPLNRRARRRLARLQQRSLVAAQPSPVAFEALEARTLLSAEITVRGFDLVIDDGDATPRADDGTDMRYIGVDNNALVRAYEIHNDGDTTLNIAGASITGDASFSILAPPAATLAPGESTSLVVQFDPSSAGVKSATVFIDSDDADEAQYNFDVAGTGVDSTVAGNGLETYTLLPGSGISTAAGHRLRVNYTGYLLDGTKFDSSLNPGRTPFEFTIGAGQVIQGWEQGLLNMEAGEQRLLVIPPALGYGSSGTANIPPNSTLIFEVELLEITPPNPTLTGNGQPIADDSQVTSLENHTHFGAVDAGGQVTRTFTLTNSEPNTSLAYGTVQVTDGAATLYSVTQPVISGNSATFTVTFTAPANVPADLYETIVFFATNNPGENPFDFVVSASVGTPAVGVTGDGTPIADGDASPTAADHTDFGAAILNDSTVTRTFTVVNTGNTPLITSNLSVPTGYTVLDDLATVIAVGASDTITLRLDNAAVGTKAGQVSFNSNVTGSDPFNFAITGVVHPFKVTGNAALILDGDATPSTTDHTDFGAQIVNTPAVQRTFTVTNTSGSELTTSNLTVPTGFVIVEGLNASIPAGGSDTFTLAIDTGVVGTKTGEVSFNTSDPGQDPFNFAVTGQILAAAAPEIVVTGNGVVINTGDTTPSTADRTNLGTASKSTTLTRTFTITNTGVENLEVLNLEVPAGFTLVEGLDSPIAPGNSDTFTIGLVTSTVGVRSGVLSFVTNDADESPFEFTIAGTVTNVPVVSIAASDNIATEGADTGTVRVSRSAASDAPLNVAIGTSGAARGREFTLAVGGSVFAGNVVTIPAGQTFIDMTVTAVDDTIVEKTEVATIKINSSSAYTPNPSANSRAANVFLLDNEPVVTVAAADGTANEDGSTGTFRVSRTGATLNPLVVKFTRSGTAKFGLTGDYTLAVGGVNLTATSVTIPAGQSSVDIAVTPVQDSLAEPTETVVLRLAASASQYNLGGAADTTATVNLIDDEPTVTVSATDAAANESGDTGTFRIGRTGATTNPLTVSFNRSGTGTFGPAGDYTLSVGGNDLTATTVVIPAGQSFVDVLVSPVQNTAVELNETSVVTLNKSSAYNLAAANLQTAAVTIGDDDNPTLSLADVTVAEGNAGVKLALVTLTLSAPTGNVVTVDYATADGTASVGLDYNSVAGTVTFQPGETNKTINVPVIGDEADEADRTVLVNLADPTNVDLPDAQAVVTIIDDDAPPTVSIADAQVVEGDAGQVNLVFDVALSAASEQTITVVAQTGNGTKPAATAGVDYDAVGPTTITFDPGQTTQQFVVPVNGDTVGEFGETLSVKLSSAVNATLGDSLAVGTIIDDDGPDITITPVTQGEGAGPMMFEVTLSEPSAIPVTVNFAVSAGTATLGKDFANAKGRLTIPAGQTSGVIKVNITSDRLDEDDETFTVTLSDAQGGFIVTDTATGTIQDDDDLPALAISDVKIAEGSTGSKNATFTVRLSAASGREVTVDYATADDTATAGEDYTAAAGTLTFPAGSTSQKVTVPILGDLDGEDHEAFFVNLSSAVNASLADAQAIATITTEEIAPLNLNAYALAATVTGGTAPFNGAGGFTITFDNGNYTLTGSGGVADSTGTYTYTRASKTGGRITATDSVLGNIVVTLTYTSTAGGTYRITRTGGGAQTGSFDVV